MAVTPRENSRRLRRRSHREVGLPLLQGPAALIIDGVLVFALLGQTLVEDRLPLIGGTQLHGVELHLGITALRAGLLHLEDRTDQRKEVQTEGRS